MKLCFDFAFYPLRKMPVTTGIYMFKFKTPEVPPIPSFCSRVYNPTCRGPITPCITHVRAHPWTYCSRYSEALYLDHPLRTVEEFNSREYFPYDFFYKGPQFEGKHHHPLPVSSWAFGPGREGFFGVYNWHPAWEGALAVAHRPCWDLNDATAPSANVKSPNLPRTPGKSDKRVVDVKNPPVKDF